MNEELFPEGELRAFLRAPAAPGSDPDFERAVFVRIRREERRAVVIPASVVGAALGLLMMFAAPISHDLAGLCGSLLRMVELVRGMIRPLWEIAATLAACAPTLRAAAWLELSPLIYGLAALLAIAALGRAAAARFPSRSTLSIL